MPFAASASKTPLIQIRSHQLLIIGNYFYFYAGLPRKCYRLSASPTTEYFYKHLRKWPEKAITLKLSQFYLSC